MPTRPIQDVTLAARMAALDLRDELLDLDWPTDSDLAARFGRAIVQGEAWLADLRAAGQILAVWSHRDGAYRFPSFQFDVHGVRPELPRLLAIVSVIPGLDPSTDRGGWARALWLYGATPLLSRAALGDGKDLHGRSAAEVFVLDPEAVITALTPEARCDPNTTW